MGCVVFIDDSKSCEPITVPMCKDIGYTMTQFPNSLGHTSQVEAGMEAHQFYPLVEINCSEHLKDFICALYVPKCDPNEVSTDLVLPTRQLCQKARDGCQSLMNMYGLNAIHKHLMQMSVVFNCFPYNYNEFSPSM
jgi:hypothetical protein